MTNQEAAAIIKESLNDTSSVLLGDEEREALIKAIKALSVDYDGMAEELSKFSGIGGLSKKGITEIIKKYVENKEG